MLYLSQILNSKVTDSSDKAVGRLKDILIKSKAGVYSPLDFLLIKDRQGKEFCIPYEYVENLSKEEVSLKSLFENIATDIPDDESTYLMRDVMDQQIVDVAGARVVRVNDLKIGLFENRMSVLGIDVSFRGLMRRLGLTGLDIFNLLPVKLIDWRKAQKVRGVLKLDTISDELKRLHPADLANIVEDLSLRQSAKLMKTLDVTFAAQIVEEMDPNAQKMLVNYLGPEKAAKIIEKMSPDEIADLIHALSKTEAKHLLSYLQNGKLKKVEKLIKYEEDTAGGLMTPDFMTGRPEWTVKKTIEEIKKLSPSMRSMLYVYVTTEEGVFVGAVSLRRLLTAENKQTLGDLIKRLPNTSTLKTDQKLRSIVHVMTKYNLYTAAVLDENKKMVGMVAIDDVMRHISPKGLTIRV